MVLVGALNRVSVAYSMHDTRRVALQESILKISFQNLTDWSIMADFQSSKYCIVALIW